jgi:hypothetical protein
MILRTARDDRILQEELPGYAAYTRQGRFRRLSGVWLDKVGLSLV